MGEHLISKLPYHIFVTHEFDFHHRDTKAYITLLEKHYKILDVLENPGSFHMSQNKTSDLTTIFEYL